MNDADFDKYYRKGGEYVLPTEVFNDLLSDFRESQSKEKNLIKYLEDKIKETKKNCIDSNYEEIICTANSQNIYLDILERIKSDKYE